MPFTMSTRPLNVPILEETAEPDVHIYRLPNISRTTIEQLLDRLQQRIDNPYDADPLCRVLIDARRTPVTTPYTVGLRHLASRPACHTLQTALLVSGNANSFLLDTLIKTIRRAGPTAIFTNEREALEWLSQDCPEP